MSTLSTTIAKKSRLRAVTISFVIFIFLLALFFTPTVRVSMSVFAGDKEVVSVTNAPIVGDVLITSGDVVFFATLAAGSTALGTFFNSLFIPRARRAVKQVRRRM